MKSSTETRKFWIKFRVNTQERESILQKAASQHMTVTDFLRERALDFRVRQLPMEKERLRQLARIGNNLNQLARWVNSHKSTAEAMQVISVLLRLEQHIREQDTPPAPL